MDLAGVDLARLRHVGPKRLEALEKLGLDNVLDLVNFYPRRYLYRGARVDLSDLRVGEEAAIFATVLSSSVRKTRQGRALVELEVSDGDETIRISFFNQSWRQRQLPKGSRAIFYGTLSEYRARRQMVNPTVDVVQGELEEGSRRRTSGTLAIYPATARVGLSSWEIGGLVDEALRRAGPLEDPLDAEWREQWGLLDRTAAYWEIHQPRDPERAIAARRRLVFDEFLRLQLLVALRRRRLRHGESGIAHPVADLDLDASTPSTQLGLLGRFLRAHPFTLTDAQRRVLEEIAHDMAAPVPMHRLVQGDVGSGKTLVATAALVMALAGGRQGALMAPTEVLAEQLYAALRRDLALVELEDPAVLGSWRPARVALLSARVKAKERHAILAGLARGEVDVLVGTHSLLHGEVRFARLGLVVIDEQHRFGVEQRATLRDKGRRASAEGRDPDLLVMTATPIPRTAALAVFGDLDRSTIDHLPPGRQPVTTTWIREATDEAEVWARVRAAVEAGRRAYVICPLVEESERAEATSAVAERTRLATGELAGLSVGLLHGQMSSHEKEEALSQFRSGEISVLVATVVVEVGVDVPEASIIVIEDAWRFGLAQLHQLRGRVGRGRDRSECYVLGPAPTADSRERLEALEKVTDGFALAEVDLRLRGEGTLMGARQRGRSDLRLGNLVRDVEVLELAQRAAERIAERGLFAEGEWAGEIRTLIEPDEAEFLFRS
jgi:ATP-dependent DNA helicase RecG